jgi:hypothetical protein
MSLLTGVALAVVGLVGVGMVLLGLWHRRQEAAAKPPEAKPVEAKKAEPPAQAAGRHRHPSGGRRRRGECRRVPRQRAKSERRPDAYDFFTDNKEPRS